ncbi:hypothetical protein FB45DRAFT_873165 [Roridomyces roridus]|uniref:F-box domain-containing protein n=1 Tax=Roridomyces roridus TaxID=1738132 RepID=A0AAD7FCH5_9AGAR|nr:hypothetical protein FB45DRAFT_873165 [Roridomyces roridus]
MSTSFLGAHGLTALSLRVEELPTDVASIHWESLRHLTLVTERRPGETPGAHDPLPILRQCSRLESLNLDFDFNMHAHQGTNLHPQRPLCDFLHLRRLSVLGTAWALLPSINAPELQYLSCVLSQFPRGETPNPVLRLVSSTNYIECLCLDTTRISRDTLMEVLRAIPMLRDLTLRGEPRVAPDQLGTRRHQDAGVVPMLSPHPTSTICPRLERLKLLNHHALSDEDLLAFVLARTTPPNPYSTSISRLSELAAHFNRWSQVDILPYLAQQIAGGLKIHLVYQPQPTFSPPYSAAHANDPWHVWNPEARVWLFPDEYTGWYRQR